MSILLITVRQAGLVSNGSDESTTRLFRLIGDNQRRERGQAHDTRMVSAKFKSTTSGRVSIPHSHEGHDDDIESVNSAKQHFSIYFLSLIGDELKVPA